MHRVKAGLLTLAFVLGYACFGIAAKMRLGGSGAHGEDAVWWVVGIVVLAFAGMAAVRTEASMASWRAAHPGVVRFWRTGGAIGVRLFGLVIAGVSILGILETNRPHGGEGVLAGLMALVGLAVMLGGPSLLREPARPEERPAASPKMMWFNLQMIVWGFVAFVGVGTVAAALSEGNVAAAGVSAVVASAGVVMLMRLLRRRALWMRSVGRYQSFAVFEAELREAAGVREDLKGYILGRLVGVSEAMSLAVTVRGLLQQGSLSNAYADLQRRRADGSLGEDDFRRAIDSLFDVARPKRL